MIYLMGLEWCDISLESLQDSGILSVVLENGISRQERALMVLNSIVATELTSAVHLLQKSIEAATVIALSHQDSSLN